MNYRSYNPKTDKAACHRIWQETGWIDYDDKDDAKHLNAFLAESDVLVADIAGEAECLVAAAPGSIRHLQTDVSMYIVAAVTTSYVGRKQGFASKLTAKLIADAAESGMETSALGMFEQGFYSRLGFGTGPYEHFVCFEPSRIIVDKPFRTPVRVGIKDYKDCHQAMMNRWQTHGAAKVFPLKHLKAEMGWTEQGFGLGYRDSKGVLTHFIWGESKDEHGPYKITMLAYQNRDQLLELFSLIKSLGDQVYSIEMIEPASVQLQDLIISPFRGQFRSERSEFQEYNRAEAFWQLRINNLTACMAKTHLSKRPTLSFNLSLSDPISTYLEADQHWQGLSGDYTIHLGETCEAISGHSKNLPLMNASVGAFSRLWIGSASANAIATADDLKAEQSLLDQLDQTLALPLPKVGWEF